MDLEDDAMNLRIKRLVVKGSLVADVVEREVKKRWPCLLSAHNGSNVCGGNGWWRPR